MKNLTEKKFNRFSRRIFIKEKTLTDLKNIANSFNEYFSNSGQSLSEKIDMSGTDMTYNDYLANSADSHVSFSPVSEKETLNVISKLKKYKVLE